MTITLLPTNDVARALEISSERCPVLIGRSLVADVALGDPWVSHCHCSIDEADGAVFIRDFGSTNGTWINGARVQAALLVPGDRLRIGSSEFTVSIRKRPSDPHESDGCRLFSILSSVSAVAAERI